MKAAGEKPGRICNYQVRQLLFEKIYTHKDGIVLFKTGVKSFFFLYFIFLWIRYAET